MKQIEQKAKFIELRAKGLSYSKIAEQLHISKSTCTSWEQKLKTQIYEAKEDSLSELYELYKMSKENRIKRLGDTLSKINKALETKALSDLPADTLLKLKLQYEQKLKTEYTEYEQNFTNYNTDEIIEALGTLYNKQRRGEITPSQAKTQLTTLDHIVTVKKEASPTSNFFELGL